MAVTVLPRAQADVFGDAAIVALHGRIDEGAAERLSRVLGGIRGRTAVWLNSPGGNLFTGMQLGRIIRKHGAWTYIVDHRTLKAGECYSACAAAFLGGAHRFNTNGARYGVHRAALSVGDVDLSRQLSAAIETYIREMGVDARLLILWAKARPDEMYVLSQREARALRVVDDGREPPTWNVAKTPGGSLLRGRQATSDGSGMVSFSCDGKQTVLASLYEAPATATPAAAGWSHLLTIDRVERPVNPLELSREPDAVRSRFVVPPDLVRLAMSAKRIGHRMKPPGGRSAPLGFGVDVDARSAPAVRKFLGDCLRRQAKSQAPS